MIQYEIDRLQGYSEYSSEAYRFTRPEIEVIFLTFLGWIY